MSAAAAVVLAGAWQALAGIFWDVAKVIGVIFIGLAVIAGALLAYGAWMDKRCPLPGLGDDALDMIRRARAEDQAEADADFEREIDEMVRRYGDG